MAESENKQRGGKEFLWKALLAISTLVVSINVSILGYVVLNQRSMELDFVLVKKVVEINERELAYRRESVYSVPRLVEKLEKFENQCCPVGAIQRD